MAHDNGHDGPEADKPSPAIESTDGYARREIVEWDGSAAPVGSIARSLVTHIWGQEGWPWLEAVHLTLTTVGGPVQVSLISGQPVDISSSGLSESQIEDLRIAGYDGPGPEYHLWPSVGVVARPGSSSNPVAHLRVVRSGSNANEYTQIGGFRLHALRGSLMAIPPSFQAWDHPPAGTWRYALSARARPGSRVWAQRVQLQAFEF